MTTARKIKIENWQIYSQAYISMVWVLLYKLFHSVIDQIVLDVKGLISFIIEDYAISLTNRMPWSEKRRPKPWLEKCRRNIVARDTSPGKNS